MRITTASLTNMAAYSKDDFYYGSDFSDFSDVDVDQEPISGVEISSDTEDDFARYCLCGLPATTDMIACDESDCKIEWFHYECVGLTAQTVPEDSWICELCRAPNGKIFSNNFSLKNSDVCRIYYQNVYNFLESPEEESEMHHSQLWKHIILFLTDEKYLLMINMAPSYLKQALNFGSFLVPF